MNTKSERDAIIANLHKIEEYCKSSIIPKLKYKDRVSVDFGELKRYNGWWEREYEHSFTVIKDGQICYRTGGLILRFKPENWDKQTIYDGSWSYGKDLILYWQEVKRKMLAQLKEQEQENQAIMDFQV